MLDDKVLEKLVKNMNEHIPPKRKSLSDLLDEAEPSYFGKNGGHYIVSKEELKLIASYLDVFDYPRLKIPILLMTDTTQGYWKVIGIVETKLISRMIDREPEKPDEILMFYPQLNDVRRKLPTATTAMYMP